MKSLSLLIVAAMLLGVASAHGGATWERWEPPPAVEVVLPETVKPGGTFYFTFRVPLYQYEEKEGTVYCLLRVEEAPRRVVFETPLRGMEQCQEIE